MTQVDRVRKVIAEVLHVPLDTLAPGTRLADVAELDSLSLVEIASALDDEFDIRLATDELTTVITLADLDRLVHVSPAR